MNENTWYYHEAGEQKGPVSEATLGALLMRGSIPTDTLVWCEGMADWECASEAFAMHGAPNTTPASMPRASGSATPTTHTIKKMPVILTTIFIIITMGIYYPCWFLTRREALNSLNTGEKLGKGVFIFAIVMFSISVLLIFVIGGLEGIGEAFGNRDFILASEMVDVVDQIILFVAGITLLVQCFKVRRMLREHFNDHLGQSVAFSGVILFVSQICYLQYKVNRL